MATAPTLAALETEIEVTCEMIEAGRVEICSYEINTYVFSECMEGGYNAMERARRPKPRAQTRSRVRRV